MTPPTIGSLVYPAFNPKMIGIVRAVVGNFAEVEFPGGGRSTELYWTFNSIDDLIDDHARKLSGHWHRRAAAAAKLGVPPRALPRIDI
jgi:hypothetical protein